MSIYKRGGTWWYSFIFDGVRVQKSTKVGDKNEARDIEKAAWTQLARGEVGLEETPEKHNLTIGNLLDSLETNYKLRNKLSAQNVSNFKRARADFKTIRAKALSSTYLDTYKQKRLAEDARPATVNRILQLVGQAFNLAIERKELKAKYAPSIELLSEEGNARQGFFSEKQFRAVRSHLPSDLQDFALFGYLTGWRKGEIASLTWSAVEDGIIRLRAEKAKNREGRSVAIEGELVKVIERRRQARAVETGPGVLVASPLVFHRNGEPVKEFRKSWANACKKAEVPGRLFHDLRRTAVRNFVRSGVPQSVAMKISGHKTFSMFKRYDITSEADLRDAMQLVERHNEAAARQ